MSTKEKRVRTITNIVFTNSGKVDFHDEAN